MKPLHAIGSLTVASIIMFAAGAKAANYSFINAAGGSAADSANWQNSSVLADSQTTASVAFTNLTQGSTATLADTPHEWKELLVANGTIAGGFIALRLMLQRIAYPEHPPCELYLDIPGEPTKTSLRNKKGTKTWQH